MCNESKIVQQYVTNLINILLTFSISFQLTLLHIQDHRRALAFYVVELWPVRGTTAKNNVDFQRIVAFFQEKQFSKISN